MALADIVEVACDDSWPGVKLVQISTLVAQQLRRNDRRQRPCWPPAAKWARLSGRKSWIFWMTPQLGSLPVRQATSRFPIPRRWSSSAGRLPRSKRMWSTFPRMSGTFTRWHGSKPMPASIAMNGRRRRRPDGRCQQSFPVGHPLAHRQECDASVRRAGRLADEGLSRKTLLLVMLTIDEPAGDVAGPCRPLRRPAARRHRCRSAPSSAPRRREARVWLSACRRMPAVDHEAIVE